MGGWRLEIAKMAMYITFPVGLFYIFNQPQFFEDYVINIKRQMFPREDSPDIIELRKEIKKLQHLQDLEELKALESTVERH